MNGSSFPVPGVGQAPATRQRSTRRRASSSGSGLRRVARPRPISRRGVASVLAMVLLILFGSLGAAMAIVTQGNLRTASSHLRVIQAMGAAETGLAVARQRLEEAASRFVIERGHVDGRFGWKLWTGTLGVDDGRVLVLPPPSGHPESTEPEGIAEALANIHAADQNTIVVDGIDGPVIAPAPAGTDPTVYQMDGWVVTPAIALEDTSITGHASVAFQITYAPLVNGTDVRAIVTGFYFSADPLEHPLTRVVMQDFQMAKRVDYAILSPNRVMIGKNVVIEGDVGARYADVAQNFGYPLVVRPDFSGLDPDLDALLDEFYANLSEYDVDGDNRLRPEHPVESGGLPVIDPDNPVDTPFRDVTNDGYVDEMDIFINFYDANDDGRITLSPDLTAGTPAEGLDPEFVDDSGNPVDDQLARLIDSAHPDRNDNGVWGFVDVNNNGVWDPGSEPMNDVDEVKGVYPDHVLGYRDGFIDALDLYAKITGRVAFVVTEQDLAEAHPDYLDQIQGAIRFGDAPGPMVFTATDSDLPPISEDTFTGTQDAMIAAADGEPFDQQVADNLGISLGDLPTYEETGTDPDAPRYQRLDPDADEDGLPDNWQTAYFEKMPFNSPNFVDWYYRPVYENMTFHDVVIPEGTNALFVNCTFIGVTLIRTHGDNAHPLWTVYGSLAMDTGLGRPVLAQERIRYGDDPSEDQYPEMLPDTATPPEQMILMATEPLDKADVPADQVATIINYDDLPDPLIVDGRRITDTKTLSNNIRFHDCLIVGSLIATKPSEYTHPRNKVQFTGKTRFTSRHPDDPLDPALNPEPEDEQLIGLSSMMLPNYSVDVGSFNSPPEQDIRLHGAVIAGIIDIRGNMSIDGTLLLTFEPIFGQGPLQDHLGQALGNPALFNSTIGYFGPDDGDQESLDPASLPEIDGQRIVGWDLDGDGLADLGPDEPPTPEQLAAGATPVPFYGFGRTSIRYDPDLVLPDGLMLPVKVSALDETYVEGRP